MKGLAVTLLMLVCAGTQVRAEEQVAEDGFPTGQGTPEGVACDAVRAFIKSDHRLWLSVLVRPIYGKLNPEYEKFKTQMVEQKKKNAKNPDFPKIKIVKVYRARNFSKNGPGSAAYAIHGFTGNKFVDVVVDMGGQKEQRARYQVMLDKDKKWYFNPRPDLSPLFSMGLNEESDSKEEWKKAKK